MVSLPGLTPSNSDRSRVRTGQEGRAAGAGARPEGDGPQSGHQSSEDIRQSQVLVGPEGLSAPGGPCGKSSGLAVRAGLVGRRT
eukprot:4316324-Lingulodinium_polyedra.AAC.1